MAYGNALAALADETRRQIFERLREGPRSVGDIASQVPVSRPAVSQHLKVLKDAGLVLDRAAGTRRLYSIDTQGLGELRGWLDEFWNQALQAFATHIDLNQDLANAADTAPPPNTRRTRTKKRAGQRRRRSRI